MADMAKFDANAVDFWSGHGRNFLRTMGIRKDPSEKVLPWSERGMGPQPVQVAPAPAMQLAPSHESSLGIQPTAPRQQVVTQQTPQGIITRFNGDGTKTLSLNQADGGTGRMTMSATAPTGRGIRQSAQAVSAPAYDFQGSSADKARFMRAPASNGETRGYDVSGLNPVMQGYTVNGTPAVGGPPKYRGPESGLGWKTRAKLYDTEMEAYNKATGLNAALDIEQMREAGAGSRALLAAEGVNAGIRQKGDQFALEQQRLGMVDKSTQELQAAQAANQTAQAARGKFIKLKVPDGVDEFGTPKFREVAVDPNKPDTVVDPAGGMRAKEVPAMPTDKKQLSVGQAYLLPNGKKATWDGKQFN